MSRPRIVESNKRLVQIFQSHHNSSVWHRYWMVSIMATTANDYHQYDLEA